MSPDACGLTINGANQHGCRTAAELTHSKARRATVSIIGNSVDTGIYP